MDWRFTDGLPVYQQIMRIMKYAMARGDFPGGTRIPSVRDLALEAGVNPNTMQRALSELEREGFLVSQRTTGKFVTNDAAVLSELRYSMGKEVVKEMYGRLLALGFTPDEIHAMLEKEGEL